ncbi:MAG: ATP-binding protein [Clostridiales bacterium]|nr:ATP-binding protein [Clostridiales bacterium]
MDYQRPLLGTLLGRIREPRRFIQVIAGPRQVGKTTIALALQSKTSGLAEYHSADGAITYGAEWIDQVWESLRIRMQLEKKKNAVLILDELQKISDWSTAVKKHWDRDTREGRDIKLVLLGSSRLLLMDGLSESLAGRYELNYAEHWSFAEMQKAFGFSAEQYQWFGGYPGAAVFVNDELRFKEYIRNAIVEPIVIRDILMTSKIDKPALLKQLLEVGICYSTQIMSFNRMLGQLQDVGNTTTLAKYLRLLDQAGLLSGLNKYSGRKIETKGTIPKFQVHNTALLSAMSELTFGEALMNRAEWGNIFESSVGAHLVNQANKLANVSLYYWRENGAEVDYVVVYGNQVIGIEVKSGDESISKKAAEAFAERFPKAKLILIGKHGIPYEVFMKAKLGDIVSSVAGLEAGQI